MANIFPRFPGGKDKALTLSYDDGVEQDIRLIDIMQRNGLKGTFNINSGCYGIRAENNPVHRRMPLEQMQELYLKNGMEIAAHSVTHPFLEKLPATLCTYEVLQDRIALERDFGCIVRGMAYPYGTYNDSVVETLRKCGIVYSRTVTSTEKFDLPTDWLRLSGTCHHNNPKLMELAEKFLKKNRYGKAELFYLWGHSYEFELNDNWHVVEEFAEFMGKRELIWYATNLEIYDYLAAYDQLVFSADGKLVQNPTAKTVYFCVDGRNYQIGPGEIMSV